MNEEELRPFFPLDRVLQGLFEVVHRLYGIVISPHRGVDVWHPEVQFFDVYDGQGVLRGMFYVDLCARPHKRGGAWMAECIDRRRTTGGVQLPVAFLNCNFTPAVGDQPILLTHTEVVTLFHEFGHTLHHVLTLVDHASISGIHGVPWDAVEMPSQLMECWCYEREVIDLISSHYQTGEPLDAASLNGLREARNFQSAMQTVRQLEFALFDLRLHSHKGAFDASTIQGILDGVREQVAVIKPPTFNRFQNSFGHIFAGGYAAGYYSYKWSELMSIDAFSRFQERGIFDAATGADLLHILEQGGSRDFMEMFIEFRGRKPSLDALLSYSGLVN